MNYNDFIQLVRAELKTSAKTGGGICWAARLAARNVSYGERVRDFYTIFTQHLHSPLIQAYAINIGADPEDVLANNHWFSGRRALSNRHKVLDYMATSMADILEMSISLTEVEERRVKLNHAINGLNGIEHPGFVFDDSEVFRMFDNAPTPAFPTGGRANTPDEEPHLTRTSGNAGTSDT